MAGTTSLISLNLRAAQGYFSARLNNTLNEDTETGQHTDGYKVEICRMDVRVRTSPVCKIISSSLSPQERWNYALT